MLINLMLILILGAITTLTYLIYKKINTKTSLFILSIIFFILVTYIYYLIVKKTQLYIGFGFLFILPIMLYYNQIQKMRHEKKVEEMKLI